MNLADDLIPVVPDGQGPGRVGVPQRVRGHLADRQHQVVGPALGQAGQPGLLHHQAADLGQVGAVGVEDGRGGGPGSGWLGVRAQHRSPDSPPEECPPCSSGPVELSSALAAGAGSAVS